MILIPFMRFYDFTGRSNRTEFWTFLAGSVAVLAIISLCMQNGLISIAWGNMAKTFFIALIIVPIMALFVRRLHDIDWQGKWLFLPFLLTLIPAIIILTDLPTPPPPTSLVAPMVDSDEHIRSILLAALISGFWAGWIWLLILAALPGTPGPNRYGMPQPEHSHRITYF
ncbi:DUF805 domain-containing protein [Entomobacter blattae]|uniref:DUF805 domain-containing protein n=1 Tax=Entomobacter blattae TaxID=2762277 RepID=A0A7H1NR56_9PROT|nr:DUF805 domain-containing protein [Entomobacter blattae]QNT78266.1 hypothetical protein JGUZn3_10380 [Entomobacter blattae]